MFQGVYSAATALDTAAHSHEVISRNLAHVNVPGFRRRQIAVEQFAPQQAESDQVGNNIYTQMVNFTPGHAESTGRNLDLAINGDGFFTVEGPDGPLYTRNGVFHLNADSQLVTTDGRPVLGNGGPVVFPPGTTPLDISISNTGSISVQGTPFAQLNTVTFADNQQLEPVGTTLFRAPDSLEITDDQVLIQTGARESSNVSAVNELVNLIVASRYFESAQRALTMISDTIHYNTNPEAD